MKKIDLDNLGKKGVITVAVVSAITGFVIAPNHEKDINDLKSENESQVQTISEDEKEIETLSAKVESAKPWFEMKKEEQAKIEEQNRKIAEQKAKEKAEQKAKEEAEQKAKEEAEQKAKEEEERRGYDTGITYSQLARTPEEYKGKKVKFEGKVIQVMEGDNEVQIRLAVGGDYDHILYGAYSKDLLDSRVLEDDYITVMGLSAGLLTYESTMGGNITIPSMIISKIGQ